MKVNHQLKSSYKQVKGRTIIECATQCLVEDGKCLVYKFDKLTKTCQLSDDFPQEKQSNKHSAAKVYTSMYICRLF